MELGAAFILGSAFCLDHLGDKASLRTGAALHEGLGLVNKSIRQRVRANVTDRERLPFALQHEINTAGEVTNTARCNRAADAHALAHHRALQGLEFGDGVVISFALSIAKPRQEAQCSYDDTDSYAKFCLFLHGGPAVAFADNCQPQLAFLRSARARGSQRFSQARNAILSGAAPELERLPMIQKYRASQIQRQDIIQNGRQFFSDGHHTLWFE